MPNDHAAGLALSIVAQVSRLLNRAVLRHQEFIFDQKAGEVAREPIIGEDGTLWATGDFDGSCEIRIRILPVKQPT